MLPILLALVDLVKAVAWPLATLRIVALLKAELPGLVRRLQEVGPQGAKFAPLPDQQKETGGSPLGKVGELGATAASPLTGAGPIFERNIRADLVKLPEDQRTDSLVRALSQAQLQAGHERVYRLIFGSQIKGLRELNTIPHANLANVRVFFDRATSEWKSLYDNYGFEGWLTFLINNTLVSRSDDIINITEVGRDFLMYLTIARLPENKPG